MLFSFRERRRHTALPCTGAAEMENVDLKVYDDVFGDVLYNSMLGNPPNQQRLAEYLWDYLSAWWNVNPEEWPKKHGDSCWMRYLSDACTEYGTPYAIPPKYEQCYQTSARGRRERYMLGRLSSSPLRVLLEDRDPRSHITEGFFTREATSPPRMGNTTPITTITPPRTIISSWTS